MSKPPGDEKKFAGNLSSAESQLHDFAPDKLAHHETTPQEINVANQPKKEESPYSLHYRPDALIWSLYLKETEDEDKELVNLWQTGLDSLLVFAGLFAGVLAAFLLESRKGLQDDPLREILYAIRNQSSASISPSFHPSRSSLLVNYFWFIALFLTLVSALAAVLAKGWLAKYAPPSPGVSSKDACQRHLRAMRARQWRFGALVASIPLLIQLALLLFFSGLAVFALDDNAGIGFTILTLIVFTLAVYILVTLLPWVSPACPFQTTISDFIPGIKEKDDRASSYDPANSDTVSFWKAAEAFKVEVLRKPDELELKTKILSWIIAHSTVEATIEEAVRVIAGLPASHLVALQKAMDEAGAVKRLCKRFSHCFQQSPGLPVVVTNVNRTEAYLFAILHLVTVGHGSLSELLPLLGPGQPLRRWDNVDSCLQVLAFCVRMEILLAASEDDHKEEWEETKKNLVSMLQSGSTQGLRRKLMQVTMRSLLGSKQVLHQIAVIVVVRCVKIGNMELREVLPNNDGELKIIMRQIMALMGDADYDVRDAAIVGFTKITCYFPAHDVIKDAVSEVMKLLRKDERHAQWAAVNAIDKLAEHAIFHDAIKDAVPEVMKLLKDDKAVVRSAAANAMTGLVEHSAFHDAIKDAVPEIMKLLKDDNADVRSAAVNAMSELAGHSAFHDAIKDAVPDVMKLLKNDTSYVWWVAVAAMSKLVEHAVFRDSIKDVVQEVTQKLKNDNTEDRSTAVSAMSKLAERAVFHDAIKDAVPEVMKLLKDDNAYVRSAAANAMSELAGHSIFHDAVKSAVPHVMQWLKDGDWDDRSAAANAISKLAEHAVFHDSIKDAVPEVTQWLKGDNAEDQWAAVNAMSKLAEHVAFHDAIKDAVPDVMKLLKDDGLSVRSVAVDAMSKLVEHAVFDDLIRDAVPELIKLLKDDEIYFRSAAANALSKFAEHVAFRNLITDGILQAIKFTPDKLSAGPHPVIGSNPMVSSATHPLLLSFSLLGNTESTKSHNALQCLSVFLRIVRAIHTKHFPFRQLFIKVLSRPSHKESVNALANLAKHATFHDAIKDAFPEVMKLMKNSDLDIQSAAADALSKLAEFPIFHDAIKKAVPEVMQWLKGRDSYGRSAAANVISKLAEHAVFRDVIKDTFPEVVKLLKDDTTVVRLAAANAMGKFADQTVFHDAIKDAVPGVMMLLKDDNPDARVAAANTLGKFAEHAAFHDAIKNAVPEVMEWLRDHDSSSRLAAANAMSKLAGHATFHGAMTNPVQEVTELLKDDKADIRSSAAGALSNLAEHAAFHDAIEDAVPEVMKLLKDDAWDVRSAAVNALGKLAEHAVFHHVIKGAFSAVMKLLKDDDWDVQTAAVNTLGKFAEHATFHDVIKDAFPEVMKLLKDDGSSLRPAAIKTFSKLANLLFSDTLPSLLIPLLSDNSLSIRSSALAVLQELSTDTFSHFGTIFTPAVLMKDLCYPEPDVAVPSAQIFCRLVVEGRYMKHFHDLILHVIQYIFRCLEHTDSKHQACGASILSILAAHDALREVFTEIGCIHMFLRTFMKDISLDQVEKLIDGMRRYGLLETV